MANKISIDTRYLKGFVSDRDIEDISPEVKKACAFLVNKKGTGKDYIGWVNLPEKTDKTLLDDIEKTAAKINAESNVVIFIGIGGSYLGARAVIETLCPEIVGKKIFFAGYNLSSNYLVNLLRELKNKDVSVNVISKSGSTLEPAIAFRIIEKFLQKKYDAKAIRERIICTTDEKKGRLRAIAKKRGYKSFVIPDDVGGRFSVLTPVGLLPIACAGVNIRRLIAGAKEEHKAGVESGADNDTSCKYAAFRNILYRKGKKIEIFSSFDGDLHYVDEWWKQLFGETEGKQGKGIFPASCDFSTDLHSMGQLIQSGERNIFETFLIVDKENRVCEIPEDKDNMDGLNYLAGKQLDFVNKKSYEAAVSAHYEGGVPSVTVSFSEKSDFCLGQLFYFFEKAAAISAYISGVNPFDQPGVESYKNKMFRLLGRPD